MRDAWNPEQTGLSATGRDRGGGLPQRSNRQTNRPSSRRPGMQARFSLPRIMIASQQRFVPHPHWYGENRHQQGCAIMTRILEHLYKAIGAGIVMALGLFFLVHSTFDAAFVSFFFRWLHVLSGILWIGLLWYFNFVQIPTMPRIPAELKPAIGKFIAPEALFWFRWAAVATVATGRTLSVLNGYGHQAMMLQEGIRTIGIGMWLGLFMAANVWF